MQNRVSLALPVIPDLVQNEGINVKKMSPNTMMIVNLISPDKRYDNIFLSNYATIYIKDELGRLPGVAGITYLGQRDYSLRAWLDPDKLASAQHQRQRTWSPPSASRIPGRRRADRPAAGAQGPAVSVDHQHAGPAHRPGAVRRHHHQSRGECRNSRPQPSTVRPTGGRCGRRQVQGAPSSRPASPDTGIVRLRDVVTLAPDGKPNVELGSQQYDQSCTLDGQPSVALSIYQLPGSNALDTASGVYRQDGRTEVALPGRSRLSNRLRHDAVHPRLGQRGLLHAARRGHPGRDRRAAVPARLAGDDPAHDRCARVADRHVRRHGGDGLHASTI